MCQLWDFGTKERENIMSKSMTNDQLLIREYVTKYDTDRNMFVVELLYYGYFGEGHNINMDTLENKGYWSSSHGGVYPALIRLTPGEFKQILREGNINVNNVIID